MVEGKKNLRLEVPESHMDMEAIYSTAGFSSAQEAMGAGKDCSGLWEGREAGDMSSLCSSEDDINRRRIEMVEVCVLQVLFAWLTSWPRFLSPIHIVFLL